MSETSSSAEAFTISKSAVRRALLALGGLILLVVLVLAALALARALGPTDSLASSINPREYQAVVLTNGQIYFGKLSAPGGDFYYLRHVYYLTAQQTQGGRPLQRTLVKLVNDVHGPEDFMAINRSQIVYMENLRGNGKAAQLMQSGQ